MERGRGRLCVICGKTREEHVATSDAPFHFTDSGLPDVYLIGVKYFTCECGSVSVNIPALEQLLALIARDLTQKESLLTGQETAFLRKRLGEKASVFAKAISVKPESLSRIENGHVAAGSRVDKLVRYHYAIESGDPVLMHEMREAMKRLAAQETPAAKIVATIRDQREWELAA